MSCRPVQTAVGAWSILIGAVGNARQAATAAWRGCVEAPPQATSRKAIELPRPTMVARTTSFLTRVWTAGDIATSSGGVGERVVEGVERTPPVDGQLEA